MALLAEDYIHPVTMAPAAELSTAPRGVSAVLPAAPGMLPGPRRASYNPADLTQPVEAYDAAMPNRNINVDDHAAVFSPATATSYDGLAYCIYRFPLDGYSDVPGNLASVAFTWTIEPAAWEQFYVGIADYGNQRWRWYAGPDDRVLTLASFAGMYDPDGDLLVLVAVSGEGDTPALNEIAIGQEEIRGTGGDFVVSPQPDAPVLSEPAGGLPASVDLSPDCSAVGDQKWWPSCTAFGMGDSTYNYELGQVYGDCGWDLGNAFNRISAKYMYVISGEFQGLHPPDPPPLQGRWFDWDLRPFWDFGLATEWNAPYNMKYDHAWAAAAADDAARLRIDDWTYIPTDTPEGITGAKVVLAVQRKVMLMRTDLDEAFRHYASGTVWEYAGPSIGGHAMAVVGYDDAKQAFKVRNSWGTDWGEAGYCWIGYDSFLDPDPFIVCWTLQEDFDPAVAERFCGITPELLPPAGLTASTSLSDRITLAWQEVPQATGYKVYRDDPQAVPVAEVGAVGTWDDLGVSDELAHAYWLRAVNATAESQLSAVQTGYRTPAAPPNADWTTIGHDTRHTCRSEQNGPATTNMKWNHPYFTVYSFQHGPVFGPTGVAYLSSSNYRISCVNMANGAKLWEENTGLSGGSALCVSDGDVLYQTTSGAVTANKHTLLALNGDSLSGDFQRWSHEVDVEAAGSPTSAVTAPVLGPDGTVYFATGDYNNIHADATLYAVTDNGTAPSLKWSYDLGYRGIVNGIAVAANGTIYVIGYNVSSDIATGRLIAIADGGTAANELWRSAQVSGTADRVFGTPTLADDGTVYLGTPDQRLTAYNFADGAVKWQSDQVGWGFFNLGLLPDGTILAIYDSFDQDWGSIWQFGTYTDNGDSVGAGWVSAVYDLDEGIYPAIGADGAVYVYEGDSEPFTGYLARLDPADGSEDWSVEVACDPADRTSLAIGPSGELLLLTNQRELVCHQ